MSIKQQPRQAARQNDRVLRIQEEAGIRGGLWEWFRIISIVGPRHFGSLAGDNHFDPSYRRLVFADLRKAGFGNILASQFSGTFPLMLMCLYFTPNSEQIHLPSTIFRLSAGAVMTNTPMIFNHVLGFYMQ